MNETPHIYSPFYFYITSLAGHAGPLRRCTDNCGGNLMPRSIKVLTTNLHRSSLCSANAKGNGSAAGVPQETNGGTGSKCRHADPGCRRRKQMIKIILFKLKDFLLHSKSFDHLTRRVGAVLLLMPCLVGIPLSLHRPFLGFGWQEWWIFPCLAAVSGCGALLYIHHGGRDWALFTAPYTFAIVHELWFIVTVPLSSKQEGPSK